MRGEMFGDSICEKVVAAFIILLVSAVNIALMALLFWSCAGKASP